MYIKKCIFFNVIVGTLYQYLSYFQNKNLNMKDIQYKNNLRKKHKTQDLVFKKPFSKRVHLEKGGHIIFGSIRYIKKL